MATVASSDAPVLWHLKVSHYNEKARWALDYKGFPHVRRAVVPGRQAQVASHLGVGTTLPILVLDGEPIRDSTLIIEELERRSPDPPLHPLDPADRRRALELEDFFDEEFGPHIRLLIFHHMMPHAKLTLGSFFVDVPRRMRPLMRVGFPLVRRAMANALDVNENSVALAWEKVSSACDRFRSELQPSGYLVGDGFSVADLTFAALCSPAVAPEQFPYPQPQRTHAGFDPLREALQPSGALDWTREMYARHRGRSAEI